MSSSMTERIEPTRTIPSSLRAKWRLKTSHNSQVSNGFDLLPFVLQPLIGFFLLLSVICQSAQDSVGHNIVSHDIVSSIILKRKTF